MSADAAVLMLLSEIRDELRGIRAALVPGAARPQLSAKDRTAAARLLPALSAAMGRDSFSVRYVAERANADTADAVALRCALSELGGNTKSVGKLLHRVAAADIGIAGLHVCAVGSTREGMLWNVTTESRQSRIASDAAAEFGLNLTS